MDAVGAVEDAGNANPDATFRYDSALNGYIFNLRTTGLSGRYAIRFTAAGDGTSHSLQFQVR